MCEGVALFAVVGNRALACVAATRRRQNSHIAARPTMVCGANYCLTGQGAVKSLMNLFNKG